jgi:hypothetical protein
LAIGNLTANYQLPTTIGTNNYVLTSNGTNAIWQPSQGGSGTVSNVAGDGTNITCNPQTGNVIVQLNPNITVSGITSNNATIQTLNTSNVSCNNSFISPSVAIGNSTTNYQLPTTIGTNNYVLTSNGTNAVWQPTQGGGGSITTVNGTANQITATTASGVVSLSLPNQINAPGSISSFNSSNNAIASFGNGNLTNALNATTGSLCVFGNNSAKNMTDGKTIVCIGNNSAGNITANSNAIIGSNTCAGSQNILCSQCVVIGDSAGSGLGSGYNNIVLGAGAVSRDLSANIYPYNNIVIGVGSASNLASSDLTSVGTNNIILGGQTNLIKDGDSNEFVVAPSTIKSMQIGDIISGTATMLSIPNNKNPFLCTSWHTTLQRKERIRSNK